MEMVKSLNSLKAEIKDNIGKDVIVKADKGRNKYVTKRGVIMDAFPSLFTVRVINEYENERTVSYTYSDLLTSTVVIKYC